jgi:Sulfate permease family
MIAEQSIEWARFAFALGFLVGIIQMAAGLLRLGFVVGFISEPVIIGFTTGAAFLIAATQVLCSSHFCGASLDLNPASAAAGSGGNSEVFRWQGRQLHICARDHQLGKRCCRSSAHCWWIAVRPLVPLYAV